MRRCDVPNTARLGKGSDLWSSSVHDHTKLDAWMSLVVGLGFVGFVWVIACDHTSGRRLFGGFAHHWSEGVERY